MIGVEGNQLPDATTVASLIISLISAGVSQMAKMLGPKVIVTANKAITIETVVMAILMLVGRPVVGPMPWMPMSNRGILIISL